MVWAEKDASSAFDHIRSTADEIFQLLLHVSRPILQHGTPDEATVVGFHFSWVPYAYGWCTAYTKVAVKYQRHMFEKFNRCIAGDRFVWPHLHPQIFCIEIGPPPVHAMHSNFREGGCFQEGGHACYRVEGVSTEKNWSQRIGAQPIDWWSPCVQSSAALPYVFIEACHRLLLHHFSFCHFLSLTWLLRLLLSNRFFFEKVKLQKQQDQEQTMKKHNNNWHQEISKTLKLRLNWIECWYFTCLLLLRFMVHAIVVTWLAMQWGASIYELQIDSTWPWTRLSSWPQVNWTWKICQPGVPEQFRCVLHTCSTRTLINWSNRVTSNLALAPSVNLKSKSFTEHRNWTRSLPGLESRILIPDYFYPCYLNWTASPASAAQVAVKQGPSPATFSRARYKLDILGMYVRRWEWGQTNGFTQHHIALCCLTLTSCQWQMIRLWMMISNLQWLIFWKWTEQASVSVRVWVKIIVTVCSSSYSSLFEISDSGGVLRLWCDHTDKRAFCGWRMVHKASGFMMDAMSHVIRNLET